MTPKIKRRVPTPLGYTTNAYSIAGLTLMFFVLGAIVFVFLIRVDFQLAQTGTLRSLDSDHAGHCTAATSRRGTKAISSKRRLKRHEASAR